jgi:DNA-binding Xre family transcriptional regulator
VSSNDLPIHARNMQILLASRRMRVWDLARVTGLTPATLHSIMSGRTRDPRVSTMRLIANGLGVHVGALLDLDGVRVVTSVPEITQDEQHVIDALLQEQTL